MGVQAGFRFYVGKGRFKFQEVGFDVGTVVEKSLGKGLTTVILYALQIPNLSLVVKMFAMVRFVDDFSYYVYHESKYDFAAARFAKLSWNLTNAKWSIPMFDPIYNKFNVSYR